MNFLANGIGYGASQDAEQAKSALLQQAQRQAGLAAGNAARHERISKEAALAQLGLAKYQGDEQRRMQEFLASQAQAQRDKEMSQRHEEFGQSLASQKENLGLELGSREKIAGDRNALEQKKIDLEAAYHDALARNDTIRAEALAKEHAATTAQIEGQTKRAEEEYNTGIPAIKRRFLNEAFPPSGQTSPLGAQGEPGNGPAKNADQPPPPAGFSTWQEAADNLKPGDITGVHGIQSAAGGGLDKDALLASVLTGAPYKSPEDRALDRRLREAEIAKAEGRIPAGMSSPSAQESDVVQRLLKTKAMAAFDASVKNLQDKGYTNEAQLREAALAEANKAARDDPQYGGFFKGITTADLPTALPKVMRDVTPQGIQAQFGGDFAAALSQAEQDAAKQERQNVGLGGKLLSTAQDYAQGFLPEFAQKIALGARDALGGGFTPLGSGSTATEYRHKKLKEDPVFRLIVTNLLRSRYKPSDEQVMGGLNMYGLGQ